MFSSKCVQYPQPISDGFILSNLGYITVTEVYSGIGCGIASLILSVVAIQVRQKL
jgi:hypothetical protein